MGTDEEGCDGPDQKGKEIWIICNEIISILENIKDMGVTIPTFLIPLVTHVKSQVEDKVNINPENEDSEGE